MLKKIIKLTLLMVLGWSVAWGGAGMARADLMLARDMEWQTERVSAEMVVTAGLPFYLVFFVLNYAVEWLIGWVTRVARKPSFGWALLLANLVTHPALYYWALMTAPSIWKLLLAELLVIVVETVVFYVFYYHLYALAKKKKNRKSKFLKCLLFDSCLMMSLALNIGSFLVGLIPGVQDLLAMVERMLTR